jgi:hypothetical protein
MATWHRTVVADSPELSGRIPYKMTFDEEGRLLFRWVFIGQKKFEESFFSETVFNCLSLPQNSDMPFTTAETLIEKAKSVDAVTPYGFIFHVSRCGSTLLTQMLCIDQSCIVISEAGVLDDVLRLPFSNRGKIIPPVNELFCAVLHLLGEKRSGKEKYLFVKTDSWHLLFYKTFRELFPDVPALLIYRSPKEVIRSQKKQRGMHAVKDQLEPEIFGWNAESIAELLADPYLELVLEKYFNSCLQILSADTKAHAISYHDGAIEMLKRALDVYSLDINKETFAAMKERTAHHSKYPGNKFSGEAAVEEVFSNSVLEKLFEKLNEEKEKTATDFTR